MKLRALLLAGAVLPLGLAYPAFAAESGAAVQGALLLAQTDQECPEGQECPPVGGGAAGGAPPEAAPAEPPAEPAPDQAPAPAEPAPAAPAPAPEAPAAEPPPAAAEPPPPAAEPPPPAAEPPPPQPEEPAAPAPAPEPQPEQPAGQPAPAQPAPAPDQPPAEVQPAPAEAAPQPAPAPEPPAPEGVAPQPAPAPEVDTTVEQQLEAQGDREEADRVRTLREQLLDQLQGVIGGGGQPPQADRDRRDGRDRDRRRRDRIYDRDEERGEVVERRGGRLIIDLGGGNIYVEPDVPDEGGRLLYDADNVEVEHLRGGRTRTTVYRRNGVQIITLRDRYGDIIRRIKVLPNGREIVLIDNRDDGEDAPRRPIIVDIRPPRIDIPRERYIVDLGRASRDDVRYALTAPPVQEIERPYSLDEVLRNEQVRAYSPRIDLDTITFEFGSATIGEEQMPTLFDLGEVMEEIIAESPDEVYLIEGHTDLVGSNYANLILSDQRAESVAVALSQNFDIPPENLVTEGYGEEYPKVLTDAPERQNRRATVRRLTDLLQAQN